MLRKTANWKYGKRHELVRPTSGPEEIRQDLRPKDLKNLRSSPGWS
ncbi:hypothetical protein [Halanaerobium saccharolyticum]|nr:hypothetical protein [Halanaerobium saccharolyticum]